MFFYKMFTKHDVFYVHTQNFESNAERSNRKCKAKHTHTTWRCLCHVFASFFYLFSFILFYFFQGRQTASEIENKSHLPICQSLGARKVQDMGKNLQI